MKKIGYLISIFALVVISIPIFNTNNDKISAATNYAAGKKVYIGNDTYTVIDSNTMTLLKNTATDAGEVTWNDAVTSLDTLADNYGELGSKAVSGKFTLPTASDLTPVTSTDQTSLVNIDPISTDWWLGDESVDNRSKFVGANTNSLVTDVSIVKNVLDTTKHVCNMNQTVIEQGKKHTVSSTDPQLEDSYMSRDFVIKTSPSGYGSDAKIDFYGDINCTGEMAGGGIFPSYNTLYLNYDSLDIDQAILANGDLAYLRIPQYIAFTELGLNSYLSNYKNSPVLGYNKKFIISENAGTCHNLTTPMPFNHSTLSMKTVKSMKVYATNREVWVDNITNATLKTVTCPGHEHTAGTSSVRPLLTLDKSKIAYSSNAKPSFDSNASLMNAVPMVDGNNAYLSLIDTDLGIALDSGDSNVSGNKLKAKRENPLVSIPVSLSGTTSGSRYVSAVAETNNGLRYNVLGQVNGSKGTVQIDLTSLKDFQTSTEFNVTLYQEVDEGTNTTYRGNGKEITIEIEAAPITNISFADNYPSGNTEWSEGDAGITTVGDIVGSFSFTGGTSGTVDPNSGKDYQKYEIVDSSGNPISDSNFRINNDELILKQKLIEGSYTFYVKVTDNANETFKKEITINVKSKPVTIDDSNKGQFYEFQLSDGSIADISKWQKENIIIHPKHSEYNKMKVNNGTYQTGDHTYSTEGENTVSLSFQKGNSATTNTIEETLKIDKSDPEISSVEFSEDGSVKSESNGTFQYLFKESADMKISAEDGESGIGRYVIKATPLKKDGTVDSSKQPITYDTPSTDTTLNYSLSKQGCYLIEISVEDQVGHKVSYDSKKIKISDQTISLEVKGYLNNNTKQPYNEKNWTNQSITLRLKASDDSALTNQQISFDQVTWQAMTNGNYTIPKTTSIDDETYYVKATNVDGDEITASIKIKLDVDKPEALKITYQEVKQSALRSFLRAITFNQMFNKEQDAKFTANDTLSGIDYYEYEIREKDNEGNNVGTVIKGKGSSYRLSGDKNYEVKVKAYDKAGNASETVIEQVQVDTKPPVISGVKDKSEYKYYYLPRYIKVHDEVSGLSYSEYNKGGNTVTLEDNVETKIDEIGEYEVYAVDNVGNEITITFKIVPLPDIETEIDGSDESKEIIDQVIEELEDIKNKIDETEKKDIEDWIKDSLEKWESSRKKVIETDDKSAKVEGQGETSFDPNLELIVDDITESNLPELPRKAIKVYDVYLQKGNVKVQPDGSIKVYLPYKESGQPIVYQIDENGQVIEIKIVLDGEFITFITNDLLRYAISNDKQEINKDNTCVEGPDGNKNSGDEVCGVASEDGKQPEKKPDGSVEVPEGGKVEFPNGTEIETPDGAIIKPDGTVVLPDGTEYDSNGNKKPNKQCKLEGVEINVDTDGDGIPDINLDVDGDCISDLNIDTNFDNIPDINIDTKGDGKPDINIDTDNNGKADLNILEIKTWKPNKTVTVNGVTYNTMGGLKPYLNIDADGDGEADYNIDTNEDGIPDKNLLDNNNNSDNDSELKKNLGGANTGDHTKWVWWWILLILTIITMVLAQVKKRNSKYK